MRAADLLQKVLERAEGELPVPSYDNMHTPDNHVGKKNMKQVANPKKGLDVKRDEHPTAEVGKPGKEKRSMEGPGTKPKKMTEMQLNELIERNPLVDALKLRYDAANEKLLVNHPGGVTRGQAFYLPITRAKLERVLLNPDYRSSPLSFYTAALRQSQAGGRHIDVGEEAGMPVISGQGRRRHGYLNMARDMIDRDDDVVYDVAVKHNQRLDAAKGQKWFHDAVADHLETEGYPMTEAAGELAKPSVSKMSPSHSASVRSKQPDEPKNKGEPGKVKKKEKRSGADGRMDANPVSVQGPSTGRGQIAELEQMLGRNLNINLGSKKKVAEQDYNNGEDEDFDLQSEMETGIVISQGRGGKYNLGAEGKFIDEYSSVGEALAAANEWMDRNKYWPNMFFVNERGNVDHISSEGKIYRSWV